MQRSDCQSKSQYLSRLGREWENSKFQVPLTVRNLLDDHWRSWNNTISWIINLHEIGRVCNQTNVFTMMFKNIKNIFVYRKFTVWSAISISEIIGPYFVKNDHGEHTVVNSRRYTKMSRISFLTFVNEVFAQKTHFANITWSPNSLNQTGTGTIFYTWKNTGPCPNVFH